MENKVKFPESKRLIDNVIMFMSKFDKNFSVSTLAKLTNYNYSMQITLGVELFALVLL